MGEGVVEDVLVEVGAVGEAFGVGGDPAAGFGVVVAAAEVDEVGDFALGLVAPGIVKERVCDLSAHRHEDLLFAESAVPVRFNDVALLVYRPLITFAI